MAEATIKKTLGRGRSPLEGRVRSMAFGLHRRRQPKRPYCGAVVPAAGQALRMNGQGKLFHELDGVPLIIHTLTALNVCPDIDEIVAVARPEDLVMLGRLCREYDITKLRHIVCGGATRAQSVLNGLMVLSAEAELAAVHDAARPFITPELASAVIRQAALSGAAAPAVPPKDTVKTAEGGRVTATLSRDAVMLTQTPQVFNAGLLKGALTRALREDWDITDDCGAVERMGMTVCLVEGSYENFKVTTPEDLLLAEALREKSYARRARV